MSLCVLVTSDGKGYDTTWHNMTRSRFHFHLTLTLNLNHDPKPSAYLHKHSHAAHTVAVASNPTWKMGLESVFTVLLLAGMIQYILTTMV